ERIYSAATTENDFFTFEEVNDGRPVVDNAEDTTGHRDPYILRSHEGDRDYMIATDLCIGCGTGWDEAQSEGSLKVNVWESTDLVTWERTNGDGNDGRRRRRARGEPARGRHGVGGRRLLGRRSAVLCAVLRLAPVRRRRAHHGRSARTDVRGPHPRFRHLHLAAAVLAGHRIRTHR